MVGPMALPTSAAVGSADSLFVDKAAQILRQPRSATECCKVRKTGNSPTKRHNG